MALGTDPHIDLHALRTPVERVAVRAADELVDILVSVGVDAVFGIPGGTIAPLFDALLDRPEIRVILTRHESAAMFAAAGYARATGKIGVVLVTSGPGVINAMTGLASAYCDGLPLLLIAGEVSRRVFGRGALQEGSPHHLNIVGMVKHITKLAAQVPDANAAPSLLRRAVATALSGRRGPVALTLPIDVALESIQGPEVSVEVETTFKIKPWAIERAASAVADGGRTLIFAGSGVRQGRGPELLVALAERLQCAVMTTPKGKGVFPEDHPLALGVFGLGGHPSTTAYLEEGFDTLITLGTSLGDIATNGWSKLIAPRKHFIQVDIDASQIGRTYSATLGIAAPAELFLTHMLERVPAGAPAVYGLRTHTRGDMILCGTEDKIAPQRALWELQQVLPDNTIYTCDSGEHFLFAVHYLKTTAPDGFMVMSGLGSMGSGICSALGAQLANPGRVVAAICGDGGFAMAASEVLTAVAEKLPVIFFVLNDERLGMVELGNASIYGRSPEYWTGPMDISALARALGAATRVVTQAGQILSADLMEAAQHGPVVVDVRIDRSIKMPKNARFEALGNSAKRPVTMN